MSKIELQKFDIELKRLLTRENLRDAVLKHLDQELTTADILKKNYVKPQDYDEQWDYELTKFNDYQKAISKRVKNPDSMKKFYAYEAVRSNMTKTELKFEDPESRENHNFTMDMMVEEAMGADYDYLLWQKDKNKYQKDGSNDYMDKEGFRANRYLNNEFVARHYGKTVFEYTNSHDVYHNMGTTKLGSRGLQVVPDVSQEFDIYKDFYSSEPLQHEKIFRDTIGQFGTSNDEFAVSKSLGWYFKKLNDHLKGE